LDFSKKNILIITDGSQGMMSQAEGLAKQFNLNFHSIKTKLIFPWSILPPGILPIFSWIFLNKKKISIPPDIIISCGRKSVYFSIYLKKKYNSISIHIQNPKINFNYFDYIVAPQHDNIKGQNIIKSIGALHKFNDKLFKEVLDTNFKIPKNNLISVIIGGSNNHYRFSKKEILELIFKIKNMKNLNSNYNFLILYSRRTTQNIKKLIKENLNKDSIIWEKNNHNAYSYALKNSDYFIVSSDSTSMISECAFTGKSIFVFHLPFKRKSKRIEKFHNQFQNLNITKKLQDTNYLIPWKYDPLNESKKIASILKERIIKES